MGVQTAAAIGRVRASRGVLAASPSIDPWTAEFADSSAGRAGGCPEIDCVRSLLAADVIDDAEHRAAALGVVADRVLIAAGELSEEAYLRALGDALGVAFEPLDRAPRALRFPSRISLPRNSCLPRELTSFMPSARPRTLSPAGSFRAFINSSTNSLVVIGPLAARASRQIAHGSPRRNSRCTSM
jgi:hypothetical protein